MKTIICDRERPTTIGDVICDGGFQYRLDFSWAKWPEELKGVHVLNGCFDEDGNLYVATEDKKHPVVVFSSEGEYLKSIGEGLFAKAHSVFLTPAETILVADTSVNYHVIREITFDGKLVRDFGTLGQPGDSGYDFNYLEVLKKEGRVPEDPVWNKSAEKNARLDSVKKLGTPFCRPCSMVMNEAGEYFAADGYGNAAVHMFHPDGTYDCSWGGPGSEPGKFRLVHDVRLDEKGRVWVSDRENKRVQVFTQEGELIAVIAGNLMRIGAVWIEGEYAYIGELDGGVTIVDMDFNMKAQLGCKGSVIHAHGITADKNGNIYVFTNKKNENNILRLVRE
ncbi:MAG: hypothetical protein IJ374_03960 [Lachnospiraceae bacterium]|nr:hypothetical protein [Lachnospiraceae bacterium]